MRLQSATLVFARGTFAANPTINRGRATIQVVDVDTVRGMTDDEPRKQRRTIILTVLIGSVIGIVWDVVAVLVLFRSYTFFESVVVCLLVMILCSTWTMRADFEPGGLLHLGTGKDSEAPETPKDLVREVRWLLKTIFYGIAFAVALVKLVLALNAG